MQATFRHGNPLMADYTPGSAVAAGDVVVVGDIPCIAHRAIAANQLGALAVGGGVYKVTADGAIAAGKKLYWDDTNNKVSATDGTGTRKVFGYMAPGNAASADGDLVDAVHAPEAA